MAWRECAFLAIVSTDRAKAAAPTMLAEEPARADGVESFSITRCGSDGRADSRRNP
jgi:hypothetical protein